MHIFAGVIKKMTGMRYRVFRITLWVTGLILLYLTSFANRVFADQDQCENLSVGYAMQVSQEIAQANFDNLPPVLMVWQQSCGAIEPLFRARTLLMIHDGVLTRENEPENLLEMAINFEIRNGLMDDEDVEKRDDYFETYRDYFGYVPVNSPFDRETRKLANTMLAEGQYDDLAKALLTLYSGRTHDFFQILKKGELEGTVLQESYRKRVKELRGKPEFNLGISSGIWMPTSDLQALGNKPFAGVLVGVKRGRWAVNASFEMRFGTAGDEVFIHSRDTITRAKHYQGGFLGLEATGLVLETGRFRSGLFLTTGFDITDLVEEGQDPRGKTLYSPAIATGFFLGYAFPNRTQLAIKPGIQFLNYKNDGGTPLSGNAITLRLVFSYSDNASRTQGLKRLGY